MVEQTLPPESATENEILDNVFLLLDKHLLQELLLELRENFLPET